MFNSGSRVDFVATRDTVHATLRVVVVVHFRLRIDGHVLGSLDNTIQLDVSLFQVLQYPTDVVLLLPHGFQGASIILLRDARGQ